MQKFNFNKRLLNDNDKYSIKKLWAESFGDDENEIDIFLDLVFENEKGVGIFFENKLVSMILFLDAEFIFKNENKNAIYFYAVCTKKEFRKKGLIRKLFLFAKEILKKKKTEYLFLVPENLNLFKLYEKFNFETKIKFNEKIFLRKDFEDDKKHEKNIFYESSKENIYKQYKNIKINSNKNNPIVLWNENEFNYIFNKERKDVKIIFLNNAYAVYEVLGNCVKIHEISGKTEDVINYIFLNELKAEKVVAFMPVHCDDVNTKNQGMIFNLAESSGENFDFIYLGMPYA